MPPTARLPYLAFHDYTKLPPHAAQSSSQVGETDGAVIFEACVGESWDEWEGHVREADEREGHVGEAGEAKDERERQWSWPPSRESSGNDRDPCIVYTPSFPSLHAIPLFTAHFLLILFSYSHNKLSLFHRREMGVSRKKRKNDKKRLARILA